jgi:hypothetical protein
MAVERVDVTEKGGDWGALADRGEDRAGDAGTTSRALPTERQKDVLIAAMLLQRDTGSGV